LFGDFLFVTPAALFDCLVLVFENFHFVRRSFAFSGDDVPARVSSACNSRILCWLAACSISLVLIWLLSSRIVLSVLNNLSRAASSFRQVHAERALAAKQRQRQNSEHAAQQFLTALLGFLFHGAPPQKIGSLEEGNIPRWRRILPCPRLAPQAAVKVTLGACQFWDPAQGGFPADPIAIS